MKKPLFIILVIFSVFLMGCEKQGIVIDSYQEEIVQKEGMVEVVNEEGIDKNIENIKSEYSPFVFEFEDFNAGHCFDAYFCDTDAIFPMGWSRDGIFAYLLLVTTDARGSSFMELNIYDTKLNEEIFSFNDCDDYTLEEEGLCIYESDDFLDRNKAFINQKLNEYKIEKGKGIELKKFPLDYKGELIDSGVVITNKTKKKNGDGDQFGNEKYRITQDTEIQLLSDKRNKRSVEVYKDDIYDFWEPCETGCRYPQAFSSQYYLQDPFNSEKILLLYIREFSGWEGPPNDLYVNFIGVDLGEVFPSKTPIKDFVYEYFNKKFNEIDFHEYMPPDFKSCDVEVTKHKDDSLSIMITLNELSPLWLFASGHVHSYYISKLEEKLLRELENELRAQFHINRINVTYNYKFEWNEMTDAVIEVYKDNDYIFDSIIWGLSDTGDKAGIDFCFMMNHNSLPWDSRDHSCNYVFYMNNGPVISRNYQLGYDAADLNMEFEKSREHVSDNFSEKDSFLTSEYYIADDVKVLVDSYHNHDYEKCVKKNKCGYGDAMNFPEPYHCDDCSTIHPADYVRVKFIHEMSNTSLSVKEIEPEFGGLVRQVFLYGHPKMKGVIILYASGSRHASAETEILPQNLLDEKLAHLYNNVGMHYYDQKDYQEAIEYFDKALEIEDEYAQAWFNKASTQSLAGESTEAIESLGKAIQINPEIFKGKAKADKDFDKVRGLDAFQDIMD